MCGILDGKMLPTFGSMVFRPILLVHAKSKTKLSEDEPFIDLYFALIIDLKNVLVFTLNMRRQLHTFEAVDSSIYTEQTVSDHHKDIFQQTYWQQDT